MRYKCTTLYMTNVCQKLTVFISAFYNNVQWMYFPSIGSICSQQLILGFFNCFIICEETLKKSKVFGAYNKIILLCLNGKLFIKLLLAYKWVNICGISREYTYTILWVRMNVKNIKYTGNLIAYYVSVGDWICSRRILPVFDLDIQ